MTDLRPDRRKVLKGAGAVAATAALLSPTEALAKTTGASQGIVGSWLFTVTTNDGSITKSLVTFDQGGTLTEAQQGDVGTTSAASPGHGAWVETGSDKFAMTIIKMAYETSGNLIGTAKNNGKLQIRGDKLTAKGEFVATDPNGNVLFSGTYTATATRIKVEGV
ncbi:MAG TPA: twin-arginine translocation signal domain-containing protein [Ktedonobacteraceae bacterium]|nr:twin-arginine translocation signal domain-containing protein [Ktedonobacteraceae bacterium]